MMPPDAWSLATIDQAEGPVACLEVGDALYRLEPTLERVGKPGFTSLVALFADWDAASFALSAAAGKVDAKDIVSHGRRLAPLLYPGKILCAGANYYDHMAEMGFPDTKKESQRLFFFMKPPRNAVIGKTARYVTPDQALSHIAGYTVAIDLSARDFNRAPDQFYKLDWVAGKACDTCCPMGPRIVPASAIPGPQQVKLKLSVNGAVKQDGSATQMIYSVAEQIARASEIMTLDPGDVVLTGTPAGVGVPKQTFLKVGDRIDAEISGIGAFHVVVAGEA
jgi:2-keto-4-pentenoate hydratase/2-oxohepta-3-ene-1,7-dioic acid hydratase in catechol pathway